VRDRHGRLREVDLATLQERASLCGEEQNETCPGDPGGPGSGAPRDTLYVWKFDITHWGGEWGAFEVEFKGWFHECSGCTSTNYGQYRRDGIIPNRLYVQDDGPGHTVVPLMFATLDDGNDELHLQVGEVQVFGFWDYQGTAVGGWVGSGSNAAQRIMTP
jgi:hypothetical protein